MAIGHAMFPSHGRADGVTLRTEFKYTDSDTDTTNKTTGQVNNATFSEFRQVYNVDLARAIYPYLTFSAGTFLELKDAESTSQDVQTETDKTTIRP